MTTKVSKKKIFWSDPSAPAVSEVNQNKGLDIGEINNQNSIADLD